ncbi:MAG TPA: ABC transporter substrate-binding protein [Cellulomonas sp.]
MKNSQTVTAAIALVAVGALGACSSSGSSDAASSDGAATSLSIGNMLDVSSWDPGDYAAGFDAPYYSAVYDPLVTLSTDGDIEPWLAVDWTWSDGDTTLTMDLASGATFEDGSPVDADAVVAGLDHLREGASTATFYSEVTDVQAADDDTVVLTLSAPDSSLLYHMGLGYSYIAQSSAIEAGTLATTPAGSGPYELDSSSQAGSTYDFTKKDGYWNDDELPYSTVEIQVLTDSTARFNALASGQVDTILGVSSSAAEAESDGFTIDSVETSWTGLMFTDRAGEIVTALGDERVRQAISYAFDKETILEEIGLGFGTVTSQVFLEQTGAADSSLDDTYSYDVDKAKELMAEAGYADGFSMTLPLSTSFEPYQAITEQSLAAIGITVTWDQMSQADYQANLGSYGMFLCTYAVDSNAYANVQSQAGAGWINPLDSATNDATFGPEIEAIAASTGDEQLAAITELNQQLVESAWFAPWYFAENLYFSDGVDVTPVVGLMFPPLTSFAPQA